MLRNTLLGDSVARHGVTFDQVVEAAEAVGAAGEEPTVDRVRAVLGSGSKSTIAPLLKRWRLERTGEAAASNLPTSLLEIVKGLHERIQGEATARIEEARAESQAIADAINQQLREAEVQNEKLSAEQRTLEARIVTVEGENAGLKREREQLQLEAVKTQAQRDEARAQLQEARTALAEQKQETQRLHLSFEHYQQRTAEDRQQERDEFRAAAQYQQSQVRQLMEQLARAEAGRAEHLAERNRLQAALDDQRRDIEAAMERNGKQKAEIGSLVLQVKELITAKDALQNQALELQSRVSSLTASLATATEDARHAHGALGKCEAAWAGAASKIAQLDEEIRSVLQDRAVLQGQLMQLQSKH